MVIFETKMAEPFGDGLQPGPLGLVPQGVVGDVHNADVMEMLPIFYEGEVVGWAAGVTHETDVGAPQPASMPIGTTSRYENVVDPLLPEKWAPTIT